MFNIYKEFLTQLNFNFKILTLNRKFNSKEYINSLREKILGGFSTNIKLKEEYLRELKLKIDTENMHKSLYYIVVYGNSHNFNVENVDYSLKILERMGCTVKKIKGQKNISHILHMCINKI